MNSLSIKGIDKELASTSQKVSREYAYVWHDFHELLAN